MAAPPLALLSLLVLISASIHIYGEYRGPRILVYIFKPLTTSLIILIALTAAQPVSSLYKTLILFGLLFSLIGDVFLMLPGDKFVGGLLSFLVGHLFYIAAFVSSTGFLVTPLFLVLYLVYGGILLILIWPHAGKLRLPVLVYAIGILVMGWQAAERWGAIQNAGALFAAVGALLFVYSDSVLALDRFRHHFSAARLMVLTSYFGAQWLIALSIYGG